MRNTKFLLLNIMYGHGGMGMNSGMGGMGYGNNMYNQGYSNQNNQEIDPNDPEQARQQQFRQNLQGTV